MRSRTLSQNIRLLAAILFIIIFGTQSFAGLGETEDTVTRDFGRMYKAGIHNIHDKGSYRVHTINVGNGMTLNEYVTGGGVVFGVSWSGATVNPDLSGLLGKHFNEFDQKQKSTRAEPANRKLQHSRIQRFSTDNIEVEMGGHMRALRGRAWVPALIPAGVTSNDVL